MSNVNLGPLCVHENEVLLRIVSAFEDKILGVHPNKKIRRLVESNFTLFADVVIGQLRQAQSGLDRGEGGGVNLHWMPYFARYRVLLQ